MSAIRRRSWSLYLALGAGGGLAYYFLPPVAKSGSFFNVLGVTSVIMILAGTRLHRPEKRLPWYLFALGQALFIAGDVISYNYPFFFGTDIPFPAISDVLYLGVYPFLIAGLLVLLRLRSPGRDRDSLIDSLIITIGAGLLSWEFLMAPYVNDETLSLLQKAVAMAYPLMDLLLLAVAVRLAVATGRRLPAFYLLALGMIALLVTDAAYGLVQLSGVIYENGGPLEAGWLAFYLMLGAAALHPSMRTLNEPAPEVEPHQPRRRLFLLAAASLVIPAARLIQIARGETGNAGLYTLTSAVLFVLVLLRLNRLMVDITEYRRTERQLRETEAKYRSLVEGLPATVYIAEFGEEGRWVYVSPQIETILGFTQEEWMSSPNFWRERILPEDRERALGDEDKALQDGARMHSEYRITARDGRVLWIREEAEALHDETGRPTYLQGVMYDITEQKQAEDRLREAFDTEKEAADRLRTLHEMQNSFLQAVSHDLRTPLTSILGNALTLERDNGQLSPEDAKDLTRRMAANARKLHRLLTNLLDLDRISRGALEPQRDWVDVSRIVRSVVRECYSEEHPITAEMDEAIADVDAAQVERIAENLITNAVRYTPAGTPITVRVNTTDDGVLLAVEDRGPGVPEGQRETIFEQFRQGSEAIPHSPGVGIGLSLVARFAELHGGKAWVEEREGGGACFEVFLPNPEAAQPPATARAADTAVV